MEATEHNPQKNTRVLILGGGFGGIYAALELEKALKHRSDLEVTLVNHENFLLFTPMLHEVAAGDLSPTHIVSPIHKMLKRVRFFCGSVDGIDLPRKQVHVSHGDGHHAHVLEYDHLVLGLGSVTKFFGLPGLAEHALTMRTLGDALHLRNRMIALLEEADFECCKSLRSQLLTFAVAGAGFAGVETVAGMQDFIHEVLHCYPNLTWSDVRLVLINSGEVVLPELDKKLGEYTGRLLEKRGVQVLCGARVTGYSNGVVQLKDGTQLPAATLVWTAGNGPNPMLEGLPCEQKNGRICVDETLAVAGYEGLWALGDCASIPDSKTGGFHPPTAQHAFRQGTVLGRNILAAIDGRPATKFTFTTLGQLASLGKRSGVAQILGMRFSGFVAWVLWRSIYLMKLPRFEKKVRVGLDWALDLVFKKDIVQIPTVRMVNDSLAAASPIAGLEGSGRPGEQPAQMGA